VRSGFLHVAERYSGVKRGREGVPQRVGTDKFGQPGTPGGATEELTGAVPV
jgi:hypothetical protein